MVQGGRPDYSSDWNFSCLFWNEAIKNSAFTKKCHFLEESNQVEHSALQIKLIHIVSLCAISPFICTWIQLSDYEVWKNTDPDK